MLNLLTHNQNYVNRSILSVVPEMFTFTSTDLVNGYKILTATPKSVEEVEVRNYHGGGLLLNYDWPIPIGFDADYKVVGDRIYFDLPELSNNLPTTDTLLLVIYEKLEEGDVISSNAQPDATIGYTQATSTLLIDCWLEAFGLIVTNATKCVIKLTDNNQVLHYTETIEAPEIPDSAGNFHFLHIIDLPEDVILTLEVAIDTNGITLYNRIGLGLLGNICTAGVAPPLDILDALTEIRGLLQQNATIDYIYDTQSGGGKRIIGGIIKQYEDATAAETGDIAKLINQWEFTSSANAEGKVSQYIKKKVV